MTTLSERTRHRISGLRSTLSAAVLGGVLAIGALGASAPPARADGREAVAVIGGIIALYALSRALNQSNAQAQPSQHQVNPRYTPGRPQPHHGPAPSRRLVAPAQCYREFQTRTGFFRGYAGDCLQRTVRANPPGACAREFRTDRGPRLFYASGCLMEFGWVPEGRHRY